MREQLDDGGDRRRHEVTVQRVVGDEAVLARSRCSEMRHRYALVASAITRGLSSAASDDRSTS